MSKNWWDQGPVKKLPKKNTHGGSDFKPVRSIDELEIRYSSKETAKFLGVSPYTLRKWRRLGIIEGIKDGRDWKFTAQQIADCRHRREHEWEKLRKQRQSEKVSA